MLSRSIAGAPLSWWIGFHAVALLLLLLDAALPVASSTRRKAGLAALSSMTIALCALGFAFWLNLRQGRQPALEFLGGYLVETSLSIDNLFVFLLLFRSFELDLRSQRRALLWGVGGAIVLRGFFISLGIVLLHQLAWMDDLLGVLLIVLAIRLLQQKPTEEAIAPNWLRRLQQRAPSILWVILAVELTDLLFALDSIPAVLAISHSPFVVYTSNIAAILGLRSLYFVLAGFLNRVRFLHHGLAVLLGFVGAKMLLRHWVEIPIALSLGILAAILLTTIGVSALFPDRSHCGTSDGSSH